jgi:phosphohistidine phosphatase
MALLLLMRHAKAATPDGVPDHERPLAPRGRRDAPRIGTWLAGCRRVPDEIWCSDAVRTRETADLVREGLASAGAEAVPARAVAELYDTSAHQVLHLLAGAAASTRGLLVVGHEPTTSEVAAALTGVAVDFRTSTLATIDLPDGWASVGQGAGRLVDVHSPGD